MKPSWVSASIKEIFEINYGKGLPEEYRNSSGSVNVYGSNGVIGKHDKSITAGPTIVLGRKGSVGEVNLSTKSCWPIDTTYFIDSFPCDLPPKYWMLYLESLKIGQHDKSTAIPGISRDDVYGIRVPLPPLNEQCRIVAELEKLLGKVDACKERLERIPIILKRFRQSVLVAASSGRLTADWREKNPDVESTKELLKRIREERRKHYEERKRKLSLLQKHIASNSEASEIPHSWELALADELFSFVTSGSRGWAKYYSEDGPLFLRIGNLDHGTISLDLKSVQRVNPPKGAEGTRTIVQPGDILISITADVGMIAVVPKGINEAYINQHIALARPLNGFSVKYVAWYLAASEGGLKQFQQLQRGMTKTGLGLDDIRSIWIPFPPLVEQQEIVRRVEALFKVADQIEQRYKKAKAYVDRLTQSILAKAFRGELVPQDPKDEPASALLEHIREERSKNQVNPQRKKAEARKQRRRQTQKQLRMDI